MPDNTFPPMKIHKNTVLYRRFLKRVYHETLSPPKYKGNL